MKPAIKPANRQSYSNNVRVPIRIPNGKKVPNTRRIRFNTRVNVKRFGGLNRPSMAENGKEPNTPINESLAESVEPGIIKEPVPIIPRGNTRRNNAWSKEREALRAKAVQNVKYGIYNISNEDNVTNATNAASNKAYYNSIYGTTNSNSNSNNESGLTNRERAMLPPKGQRVSANTIRRLQREFNTKFGGGKTRRRTVRHKKLVRRRSYL